MILSRNSKGHLTILNKIIKKDTHTLYVSKKYYKIVDFF